MLSVLNNILSFPTILEVIFSPPQLAGSIFWRLYLDLYSKILGSLWTTTFRVQSPSQLKKVFICYLFKCNLPYFILSYCLLSFHWASLRRAWLHSFYLHTSGIYIHWSSSSSSPGWTIPVLSASYVRCSMLLCPYVHVSLLLGSPRLDTALQIMSSHQAEGKHHPSRPSPVSQDVVGHLCCKSTLLSCSQLLVYQYPLCRSAFQKPPA